MLTDRLLVVAYWCFFNTMLFMFFGMFCPEIVSVNIAMIITVAAFANKRNKRHQDILTRPVWFINQRY